MTLRQEILQEAKELKKKGFKHLKESDCKVKNCIRCLIAKARTNVCERNGIEMHISDILREMAGMPPPLKIQKIDNIMMKLIKEIEKNPNLL